MSGPRLLVSSWVSHSRNTFRLGQTPNHSQCSGWTESHPACSVCRPSWRLSLGPGHPGGSGQTACWSRSLPGWTHRGCSNREDQTCDAPTTRGGDRESERERERERERESHTDTIGLLNPNASWDFLLLQILISWWDRRESCSDVVVTRKRHLSQCDLSLVK